MYLTEIKMRIESEVSVACDIQQWEFNTGGTEGLVPPRVCVKNESSGLLTEDNDRAYVNELSVVCIGKTYEDAMDIALRTGRALRGFKGDDFVLFLLEYPLLDSDDEDLEKQYVAQFTVQATVWY